MKKIIIFIIAVILVLSAIAGCSAQDGSAPSQIVPEPAATVPAPLNDPIETPQPPPEPVQEPVGRVFSVVAQIFPQYDWVRQITGDRADSFEMTLLLDNLIDLHNFNPSVQDIVRIGAADLFIYVGGDSDDWVEDILAQAANPDMIVINLMESLGDSVKLQEIIEGMDDGDDHGHSHGHNDSHNDEEEEHYDEHVWLSLRNAISLSYVIADAISVLDPENIDEYRANLSAYIVELVRLDAEYESAVSAASGDVLLFGDRFPFRYFCDDYNLRYYAAFTGCSAETEASFSTIAFLTNRVNDLNLSYVMVTECSDQSIANTIVNNSRARNQQVLVMDSMQSVTSSDVANGVTYLGVMRENLNVLIQALS